MKKGHRSIIMLEKLRTFFRTHCRKPIGIVAISFGIFPFFQPKQQPYTLNFDQTINFFAPGQKWPIEKLFSPVEKQVYQQYGKPDLFRFVWSRDGSMKMREALTLQWTKDKLEEMPPFNWVYLKRNQEIKFTGNTFEVQPLTETMHLVIKYGDPEHVRDIGSGVVQWTYYSIGKIYTISNDKIVGERSFPAMGSFHK